METLFPSSLALTVNAVNEAFLRGREIAPAEARRTARWIAGRQGLPGSYHGTFALTDEELGAGPRLFTGEKVRGAGARHIFGEEACRTLRLLGVDEAEVRRALDAAAAVLDARVGPVGPPQGTSHWFEPYRGGVFCCGSCSVGFWRHLTAGGFDDHERRISVGLSCLAARRKDDHRWATFPFWYTVSALVEMPVDLARPHVMHAAPRLERAVARPAGRDAFAERRRMVAERALAMV